MHCWYEVVTRFALRSTFVGLALFDMSACSSTDISTSESVSALSQASPTASYLKADGNELVIKVKKTRSLEVIVIVTNRSSRTAYLPYYPGGVNDEFAVSASLELERMNEATGVFESAGSSHFVQESNPLEAGGSFKHRLWISRPGLYRFNVGYTVDEALKERIVNIAMMEPGDAKSRELEEADKLVQQYCGLVTSGPFQL